ncbi:MAG TPA: 7TM-DISM domain-containing protein, partial [Spirochaetota bacterium]|nr:7TM-DISM domain-containing protein [Spirochaetota bacterium]
MKLYLSAKVINAVVCLLFCMIFLSSSACKERSRGPVAVQGILDLGGWNLEKDGVVTLDGEWEFCRDRLMEPTDFRDKGNRKGCGFITVPGLWKNQRFNGIVLPGRGSATYRLKILSRSDAGWATLSLRRIHSGYTLWINGKLEDKKGTPDRLKKTREDYVYVHNKRQLSFTLNKGENDIVLQVINNEYESGGINRPLYLEDGEACTQRGLLQNSLQMIIVGLLLFSAIYNVLFYYYRKEDMASLHLAFFSLVTAVNTYNIQNPILSGVLFWPPNPFLINYITAILIAVFPLVIAGSLFPDDVSIRFVRFFQLLCVIFIVPLFVLRFKTAEQLFKVFMIFMVIFFVYMMYVIVKTLIHRRNDARLFFIGFLSLVIAGVNNILYAMWIIDTGNMLPYAMVIFCIVTTMVVSRRFARALLNVEDLSKELETKNISLQKMDRIKDQF